MPKHEQHFFNFPQPVMCYLKSFQKARPDQLVGEKTPGYLNLTRRQIARVRKLLPDVRLIVVLRKPVPRSWSQAHGNLRG